MSDTSHLPVLVVTGLAREARVAAGPDMVVLTSGGSPARLRAALAASPPACRAVLSFGLAGGLDPGLSPGAVVLATEIVAASERWRTDPALVEAWAAALSEVGQPVTLAAIAGVDTPLLTPFEKAAQRRSTGAAAADMESHIAAAFAARHGLPFGALRTVCDPASRALPPLVAAALRPDGGLAWARILDQLVRRPAQVAALPRLAADAAAGIATLSHCRALLGPGLGFDGLGEALGDML